ncbi:MAG: hypothetical protein LUE89_00425 [Clostridiales bacterium]|nr:hypothetical protein [Clostridiales bacterium]
MGKGLFEYAAQHEGQQEQPAAERETMAALAADQHSRAEDQAQATADMERIRAQLTQGDDPEIILYRAIRCIGCLAHSPEWAAECSAELDKVYGDLMQQSMERDAAAEAKSRLEERTRAYTDRVRRQLEKQIKDCGKLTEELNRALLTLDGVDPEKQKPQQETDE